MAAGDITPTTPRTDTGLSLREILVSSDGFAILRFVDAFGSSREAVVRNGDSVGFNYATGAALVVNTPTGYTDLLTALTLTNAKRTAIVNAAKNAGVIVVTGTVA